MRVVELWHCRALQRVRQAITAATAAALGTDASLVIINRVEYVLSFVVALPGINASAGISNPSVRSAVAAATGSSLAMQVLGVNAVEMSRRRLLTSVLEATLFAFRSNSSLVGAFNASLVAAVANGGLTSALRAAGVNTSGAVLPVGPVNGVQFGITVQCPIGATDADGTALPNVTQVLSAAAPGALDATPTLAMDLTAAGLSNISGVKITLAPIAGACIWRWLVCALC